MSSNSRIPLSVSTSTTNAVRPSSKRDPPANQDAVAAKRARPITSRDASPSALSRPLPSSSLIGRATTVGVTTSAARAAATTTTRGVLRPPQPVASRVRSVSSSQSTSIVDKEKEELKKKVSELTAQTELHQSEKEEWKKEKDELRKEKEELRNEKNEAKEELRITKSDLSQLKTDFNNLKEDLKNTKEELAEEKRAAKEKIEGLKKEAIEKDEKMRKLHNDVVDLRGRIRTAVRVRPLLGNETEESTAHIGYPDSRTISFETTAGKPQQFSFNYAYAPNYTQARIFESVQELIMSVLHGYNVCLIAFGQTGSGKTHTMRGGTGDSAGLIPRSVEYLFEQMHKLEELDWTFTFAASFLEVYNNECYDLLSVPARNKCEIKQQAGKFVVDKLTSEKITSANQMGELLRRSDASRSTAATKCNEESSRSHAIFSLQVDGLNGTTGAKISSTLKLVDLAGSERAKESGVVGDRFNEMTHINTALSNLQTCIRSILTKQSHVPYRNSRLTTLLQDSLEGGSKCMVILSLSPALSTLAESKRTLEFGRNLSQTHIGAAKKRET